VVSFLLRRIVLGVGVLWAITTVVFVMFFVAPTHVAQLIAGRQATPQTVALVSQRLGLDRPILTQYLDYLWRLLHGDLGYSYYNSTPVTTLLWQRVPVTASLALGAAVLWLVIGISSGVLASIRPRSLADRVVTASALFFYSMPIFLLGLILLYFLFYKLTLAGFDLFPGSGYVPLSEDPVAWLQHLVLPWLSLALVTAATYTRLTRGAMLDVLGEDYIRTARSKGMRERRVTSRHALRSALTPAVTQLGIDLGTVLGGAIITENVFGLPGLGQLAVQSVVQQDQPVIIGTVILAAAFIVISSIVVDLVYAVLDPRVRAH
jgi:peptide/nickel transport system permease protein